MASKSNMSVEPDASEPGGAARRRAAIDRLTEAFRRRLERRMEIGTGTLDEIEQQVLEIGEETVASVRKEILDEGGDGYTGSRASCSCGRAARYLGCRPRQVVMLSGVHVLVRACYHCRSCRKTFSPLDGRLDLLAQGCSRRVMAAAVRFCSFLPFALASRELAALCGIRLAASTLARYCLRVGDTLKKDWSVKEATVWSTAAPAGDHRPKQLQFSMDGAIIYVGGEWREAKLGVVYERRCERVERARYYATLESSAAFGRKVRTLVHEAGSARCAKVGAVADGSAWIWQEVGKYFPLSVQVLDYYHATEHLWEGARAQFGEGTPAAKAWMSVQEQALLDDRVGDVLCAVAAWAPKTRADQDLQRKLHGYLTTHRHRMRYKTLQAGGWHIGSGVMESGCKCVVKARMGGAGMRWGKPGAEAMLHICAHWRSFEGGDFLPFVN
jgi:hypothetical protein